jgi:hypothetical protein
MLQDIPLCHFTKPVALVFDGGLDIRLEMIKIRILLSEAFRDRKCSLDGIIKSLLFLHQLPFRVFSGVISLQKLPFIVSCEKGRGISCSTPAGIFFSIL